MIYEWICITVIVDINDSTSIEMAPVWKRIVVNNTFETVPVVESSGGKIETTTMEKKPVDPETFPILLLGNKFDLVSNVMWFSMKKIIQAGTSWGINITMSNVIVKSWARLKPCIFCMKVTTLSTDLMEISTSLTNEGRLNLLLFLIGQ